MKNGQDEGNKEGKDEGNKEGNPEGNKEEGNQHAGLVKNTDNSDNYAFDLSSESEDVVR